ncbi:FG-GAP and VCBS repeat-containing protein [Streptomyces kunmingensis]|uniref:FG-GAP and VCBS repeat-containing protein n=1 Tax=Streptomyces kunmingensis TaxID=68225 RepID=A0ABU6CFQ0_9ACTN|nr:FG-GAP-like repeat-containing protein [Streptomyces kunmingensis]MEB3963532.1 FG-GAP and VCBS repeat-containing protein [Streptomyces kunmingensis]
MQHRYRRAVIAASVVAAVAGGLLTVAPGAALAAGSGVPSDFNGDGVQDLAVGAPGTRVGGKVFGKGTDGIFGAGSVVAYYGGADGVSPARHTYVDQDKANGLGSSEAKDLFGASTATGDFDADGFADLAVSAPHEDVPGDADNGEVQILWGSPEGLTGGTVLADPAPTRHDNFGAALAAGDFDGDGKTDLVIGSSSDTLDILSGGIAKDGTPGAVSSRALPLRGAVDAGILGLTAGDVNNDGRTDLIVDGLSNKADAAGVYNNANYYLPGSASGLTAVGSKRLSGGESTAIGDIDGDGFGDIAIGAFWGRTTPDGPIGGRVVVNYGSAKGVSDRTETITQESGNVPGDSEDWDKFGGAVALGDVDGDGKADLAVGAQQEDYRGSDGRMYYGAGSVTLLYGSAEGADTTDRVQYFHQASPGVPGSWGLHMWGSNLLMNDLNGDHRADVAVGAVWDDGGDGSVTVLPSDGQKASAEVTGVVRLRGKEADMDPVGYPQFGSSLHNSRPLKDIRSWN